MQDLPDKVYDWAIVDPPYFSGPNNLGFYGNGYSNLGVKRHLGYEKIGSWNVPGDKYFAELKRVSKNQIVWGINYYAVKNLGTGRIIWDKCNGSSSFSDCEIAWVSSKKHVRMFRYMWNGMMQGKSIKEGHIVQGNKKLNEKRIHPTQKPVALYKWLLQNYAKEGDKILDTHLGSGSIAIACHDLGFSLTACELDKTYFSLASKRLAQHQRQLRLF